MKVPTLSREEAQNSELTKLKEQNCMLLEQVASLRREVDKLKAQNATISDHVSKLQKEISAIEWEAIRCNPNVTNEIAFVASLREKVNKFSCSKEKSGIIQRRGRIIFKLAVIAAIGVIGITSVDFLQEKVTDVCTKAEMKYDNDGAIGSLVHTTCGAMTSLGSRINQGNFEDEHMEILMSNFSTGKDEIEDDEREEDDGVSSDFQHYGDMANDVDTTGPDVSEEVINPEGDGDIDDDITSYDKQNIVHEESLEIGQLHDESVTNNEDYGGREEIEGEFDDVYSSSQQYDDMPNDMHSENYDESESSNQDDSEEEISSYKDHEEEDESDYVYSNFQQYDDIPNDMDSTDLEERDSSEVLEEDEIAHDNLSEGEFYFPEEEEEDYDEWEF